MYFLTVFKGNQSIKGLIINVYNTHILNLTHTLTVCFHIDVQPGITLHYVLLYSLYLPLAGASEISDSCKPLKKRSRASTDVEVTSSIYRDASDSDSRGLNDMQVRQHSLSHKSVYMD